MKVKTEHGTFDVPNITFKDRRSLHHLEVKAIQPDGSLDTGAFFHVLDWILNFAFDDPEKSLGKFNDNDIDSILMSVYNAYKEPDQKK